MSRHIYLGNNLTVKVEDLHMGLTVFFKGHSVSTSCEVGHSSLELISNHDKWLSYWSEGYEPYWTNGTHKEQRVQFTLKEGESVVVMHNDQNQIDTYFKLSNVGGKLKYTQLCSECFWTNEFQGLIGHRKVTEEEYREFVSSL